MTDEQFDLLDELYFIQPFDYLQQTLGWPEERLKKILLELAEEGWIRCYVSMEEEAVPEQVQLAKNYNRYFYLASKAGLFAHNGR